MTLRLLTYNIRYGGRGREEELASVIRAASPDVVVLQEATDPRVVERLAVLADLPHCGSRRERSTAFLSRLPVAAHSWTLPPRTRHAFLELNLEPHGIRIFALHLSAWFSKWSERRRSFELQALLEAIREHQDGCHFIAGDFNALAPGEELRSDRMPPWIRAMVWLSGRDIARDTIQLMIDRGYVDAWRARNPYDAGYTFPTWDPHVRLDYVFTPLRYQGLIRRCDVFTDAPNATRASDHFPLVVDVEAPAP